MQDRGGVGALAKVLEGSAFPIVLTANDPFDTKLSPLKKASALIEFPRLSTDSLVRILQRICKAEAMDADESMLRSLARRCGGDARALINDLQTLAMHSGSLTKEDIDALSSRNQDEEIALALNKILKNTDLEIALNALDSVDEDTDKAFLWIDENMPKEYKFAEDLAGAYDSISRADVFAGRIRRWQHWRFLVYVYSFLTGGVAIAKKRKYEGVPNYSQPSRLLKIWIANSRNARKKGIASKLAAKTNESVKKTIRQTMPYLRIICRDPAAAKRMAAEYGLTDEETEWLTVV
jgi:replication factor C large subunit